MKFLAFIFLLLLVSCSHVKTTPNKNEVKLNYTDSGKPDGIPVLFIHAFPLNKQMWAEQEAFLKNNYRVISFDIRGLGKSELSGPYTMEFIVDDVVNLLDKLKIQKVVVCGLSMGGFVALRAIQRNPERFMGLVLADTKSEPDSDSSKLGRYNAIKTLNEKGLSFFANSFLQISIAQTTQLERSAVVAKAMSIAESNTPTGVSSAVLALTSRLDTSAGLANINVPTLVLQGEFDTVIPMASAKLLSEKINNSTFYVIPKAGHLSNLENPTVFNDQLSKFLSKSF